MANDRLAAWPTAEAILGGHPFQGVHQIGYFDASGALFSAHVAGGTIPHAVAGEDLFTHSSTHHGDDLARCKFHFVSVRAGDRASSTLNTGSEPVTTRDKGHFIYQRSCVASKQFLSPLVSTLLYHTIPPTSNKSQQRQPDTKMPATAGAAGNISRTSAFRTNKNTPLAGSTGPVAGHS